MSTILIPLDGSELSDRILSFVDHLPQRQSLRLVLLRVLRRVHPDELSACKDEFHAAMAHLFSLEARLRSEGTRAVSLVSQGEYAAEQILELVSTLRPDMVAMSTHGRSGVLTNVRGGVAERVVRGCPVPLLLGNPQALPLDPGLGFARIVVPLDGTPVSARILPYVKDLATRHGSEVVLLAVSDRPEADLEPTLAPYRHDLLEAGIKPVRIRTASGDPGDAILSVVKEEGADLLAMTSHSRVDPEDRAFGSVAEKVIASCGSPLLLVRIARGA